MDFELEDGEGDDDNEKGVDIERGGGMGFPFLDSAKTSVK